MESTLFPSQPTTHTITPLSAMSANTINLLTCRAAGLLPPTTSPFSLPSPAHHLPAIADQILASMLASSESLPHHLPHYQHYPHALPSPFPSSIAIPSSSSSCSEKALQSAPPSWGLRKRSLGRAFPGLANESGEEDGGSEGQQEEKKGRRLTAEQVGALEQAFEEEERVEPERRVRLATQLGLQPRQVSIWFQNRRARWRTKRMEKEYDTLKQALQAMEAECDALLMQKEELQAQVASLKAGLPLSPAALQPTAGIDPHPSQQGEMGGTTSCNESSEDVEAMGDPHPNVDSSACSVDPTDFLTHAAAMLDIPEASHAGAKWIGPKEGGGGLCEDGIGGWSPPSDWWE